MRNLQWKMEESFYFPGHIGVPQDAQSVKVKAGFTEKRTDDAVRLTGIYHIAAKINFLEGERREGLPDSAVFIDDVELEGMQGYFEYAVPLNIDLPPEVGHPMHVHAKDVKTTVDEEGVLQITWDVDCVYGEDSNKLAEGKVKEPEAAVNEVAKKEPVVADEQKEKAAAQKEEAVVHAETKTEKQVVSKQIIQAEVSEGKVEENAVASAAVEKEDIVEEATAPLAESKAEDTVEAMAAEPEEKVAVAVTEKAPRQEEQTALEAHVATYDSSSFTGGDDMLSYIASLQDEWTTTTFRSNDVFV
ncbi:hypothetical protein NCCP2222_03890 [Sporosarcina sp. NCCP-2222]|uniref:hypothetical protein n=1 Tax=Sporosarcina sp. NCCP-2222 TaxID=2935073 RepID=UPI002086FE56|nr:hypothetical protein [Sporosarcina sp. NCCP-2222]GKV54442.1 hypothetical protein NCCP2222_03890 [Sporosarcina sp. NCCP-2222]